MKYHTVVQREGELLGPVDWDYNFRQHFDSMGTSNEAYKAECTARAVAFLRQISDGDPSGWRVLLAHGTVWRNVYAVGMYDGWPFWKPTPALLTSGTLGAEWHFFYDLRDVERVPVEEPEAQK